MLMALKAEVGSRNDFILECRSTTSPGDDDTFLKERSPQLKIRRPLMSPGQPCMLHSPHPPPKQTPPPVFTVSPRNPCGYDPDLLGPFRFLWLLHLLSSLLASLSNRAEGPGAELQQGLHQQVLSALPPSFANFASRPVAVIETCVPLIFPDLGAS